MFSLWYVSFSSSERTLTVFSKKKIDEVKINLNYKNDEVDDLKLISLREMDLLLSQNNRDIFIGKNKNYYNDVFEAILKITKENYL